MSIEIAVVIDNFGKAIYWHTPKGRTGGSIPDSHDLWVFFQENQNRIMGLAHSHPGSGVPSPSKEDITTFSPIELALGKRFVWWIASSDSFVAIHWFGPEKYDYDTFQIKQEPLWVPELRIKSGLMSDNLRD